MQMDKKIEMRSGKIVIPFFAYCKQFNKLNVWIYGLSLVKRFDAQVKWLDIISGEYVSVWDVPWTMNINDTFYLYAHYLSRVGQSVAQVRLRQASLCDSLIWDRHRKVGSMANNFRAPLVGSLHLYMSPIFYMQSTSQRRVSSSKCLLLNMSKIINYADNKLLSIFWNLYVKIVTMLLASS